ncbi:MAG: nucleoside-diphosphate kinase [Aquificota bacterium]|nr:MAG: nucleoside-diphosphate kinase [Aquificota bacterium]
MEQTLAIIKPDAVERNLVGEILKRVEEAGLRIAALKMLKLSKEEAQGFYYVHRERPFFDSLTDFMSSGPIVVAILQGEKAIERWRSLMGATDPAKAEEGTIRKAFGLNVEKNSVHGSDSPESAAYEIAYFFSKVEVVNS